MLKVVSEIWKSFSGHVELAMGIFTLTGIVLSLFALFYSARSANAGRDSALAAKEAAEAAKDSARIAQEALEHARKSSSREEFALLLNQHNAQLDIVKHYLDGNEGAALLKKLNESGDLHAAFNQVRTHSVISPYMRILHQLLKHISHNHHATPEEQRENYVLVRSLIRNDVLFLIAVNSSYVMEDGVENAYAGYQRLLQRFDFFEHARFYHVIPGAIVSGESIIQQYYDSAISALNQQFRHLIREDKTACWQTDKVLFPTPVLIGCIFDNPLQAASRDCIEQFINAIVTTFEDVKKRYLVDNSRQREFAYVFNNIIGRYAVTLTAARMVSVIEQNNITQRELGTFPVANEAFIRSAVADLKTGKLNPAMHAYYCKLVDQQVIVSTPSEFKECCQRLLNWTEHLQNVENGGFTFEVQAEAQRWQDFYVNVLLHRLA